MPDTSISHQQGRSHSPSCSQCRRSMGSEWILGPVCGKCCRANHARVTGQRIRTAHKATVRGMEG
jgi:hypothetical protein